jgi:hypothetical protein
MRQQQQPARQDTGPDKWFLCLTARDAAAEIMIKIKLARVWTLSPFFSFFFPCPILLRLQPLMRLLLLLGRGKFGSTAKKG